MIVYLSLLFALFTLRFAEQGRPRLRGQTYYLVLIGLFLFSAFRFEVGCDWTGYLSQWNKQKGAGSLVGIFSDFDPLWWAMMQGIQSLGLPYPWLNVLASTLFFAGAHAMARRQPDPLAFLILLYPVLIINMPMSGIRQGAAIGVLFFAYNAFTDKRAVRYGLLVLLASLIHQSSLILILLLPLVRGGYSRQRIAMSLLLAMPGAFVLSQGEASQLASERYVNSGLDAAGSVFRVGLIGLSGLGFHFFLRRSWRHSFPQDFKLAAIGSFIMMALIALVPISSVIGDRVAYYLIPVQAMIFARIPYLPLRQGKPLLIALPYFGLGLLLVVWTGLSGLFDICYTPYQTWLFGVPLHITHPF